MNTDEALKMLRDRLNAKADADRQTILKTWNADVEAAGSDDSTAHSILCINEIIQELSSSGRPHRLIIILHGIRDAGVWMEALKDQLSSNDTVVQPLDFSFYISPFFMTGVGASWILAKTLSSIRDTIAEHQPKELVIIAHSFGTYIVCNVLLKNPEIRCNKLIMCGAVVSKNFPFRLIPRPPQILNECGGRDIWPVIAQGFNLKIYNRYGASGVWGLRLPNVVDRYHDTGHSDYLTREFAETYWVPFIYSNQIVKSSYQANRRPIPWGVSLLSVGLWIVLILIGLGVVAYFASLAFPVTSWIAYSIALLIILLIILAGIRSYLWPSATTSSLSTGKLH
jgi:pimeloyl-ACP methyl ester carboxylesterase